MTPSERFHKQIWAALGPLDDAVFEAIAARPPTEAEVRAVESALDAPLPDAFMDFSAKSNGLLVVAREACWPQPQEGWVGPAWKLWRGVVLLGFDTEDLPDWASLVTASQRLQEWGVEGVAPIFKVLGDGERIWGVDRSGTSVRVSCGEIARLDATIAELYAEEILALVDRQMCMHA